MPFITQDRRQIVLDYIKGIPVPENFKFQPGDWCYFYYQDMVRQWKENPRWTTAHHIYESIIPKHHFPFYHPLTSHSVTNDNLHNAAMQLAWQVFFQNYVMPYEREKEQENGTI